MAQLMELSTSSHNDSIIRWHFAAQRQAEGHGSGPAGTDLVISV